MKKPTVALLVVLAVLVLTSCGNDMSHTLSDVHFRNTMKGFDFSLSESTPIYNANNKRTHTYTTADLDGNVSFTLWAYSDIKMADEHYSSISHGLQETAEMWGYENAVEYKNDRVVSYIAHFDDLSVQLLFIQSGSSILRGYYSIEDEVYFSSFCLVLGSLSEGFLAELYINTP
jgi:hypothetical protein